RLDHDGRQWDVTGWVPGIADFETNPSDARLADTVAAVAALHRAWRPVVPTFAPCPAAARRVEVLSNFLAGRIPVPKSSNPLITDAVAVARRRAGPALAAVRPFAVTAVPVQPCLRDIWHDHILFTGDVVTGVVDYGAIGEDHPAADVARLLGDLTGADRGRTAFAVDAYRAAGGNPGVTEPFVTALADAGLVGGLVGWLDRLATGLPANVEPDAVFGRIRRLLARLGE
ncbi:MAG: phosphotransferase, partial [Fimbriiglobus sp.]